MPKYKKEFGPYAASDKPKMYRALADWMETHPAVECEVTEEKADCYGSDIPQYYVIVEYVSDGYLDPIEVFNLDENNAGAGNPENIYTNAFWTCACDVYVHPVTQDECPVCLQEREHGNDALVTDAIEYCEGLERSPVTSANDKAIIRDLMEKMLSKRPKHILQRMVVEVICEDWFSIGDLLNANVVGLHDARERTDLTLVEVPLPMVQEDWDKIKEIAENENA